MDRYSSVSDGSRSSRSRRNYNRTYISKNRQNNDVGVGKDDDDGVINNCSSSCGGDHDDDGGALVEVTLQCLRGIRFGAPKVSPREWLENGGISKITAAVAFSGSATDMQVGSSMVCGRTGQLLVESLPARFEEDPGSMALEARWADDTGAPTTTITSPQQQQQQYQQRSLPHLTIRLPHRDPRLPTVPISKMNRNSRLVDDDPVPPLLDDSDSSTSQSHAAAHHKHQQQKQQLQHHQEHQSHTTQSHDATTAFTSASGAGRGGSVVWSASGAAMPEIVELHVSLLTEEDEEVACPFGGRGNGQPGQQGIAHLVFYGNDEGSFVLDLPVKKPYMPAPRSPNSTSPRLAAAAAAASPTSSATTLPSVWLDPGAFLRVRVTVLADGEQQRRRRLRRLSQNPITSPVFEYDDPWATILHQLNVSEQRARRILHNQQRQHYGGGSGSSHAPPLIVQPPSPRPPPSPPRHDDDVVPPNFAGSRASVPIFCQGSNWVDAMVESLSQVMHQCDGDNHNNNNNNYNYHNKRGTLDQFPAMIAGHCYRRRRRQRHGSHAAATPFPTKTTTITTTNSYSSDDDGRSLPNTDTMLSTIATRDSLNI